MRAQMFGAALRGGRALTGTVTIGNKTVSDLSFYPASALARYRLADDGLIELVTSSGTNSDVSWLIGSTNYSGYEVQFTTLTGSPVGATGSWLALSSDQQVSISRSSNGTTTATLFVEIRDASTLVVKDSATITLSAEVSP